jgi:hypothetical protein
MADRNSFLIVGNGIAQPCAYAVAVGEVLIREWLFWGPGRDGGKGVSQWVDGRTGLPGGTTRVLFLVGGLVMIIVGQAARSMAMREAGASFNHLGEFGR